MAAFNPVAQEVSSDNMTRRSQGIGTSSAFGTLFGGIGDLAGKYAVARDQQIQKGIYEDTVAQRDAAAGPFATALQAGGYTDPLSGADPTKATRGTDLSNKPAGPPAVDDNGKPIRLAGNVDPNATGGIPTVSVANVPPEIKSGTATMSTLQSALASGSISQAYYDNQLASMVKGLRMKYPGYNQQIDAIVQNVTGKDPANALVADFYAEARANQAAANSEETKWQSYTQNEHFSSVIGVVAPDVYTNPAKYADPAMRARVHYLVSQYDAKEMLDKSVDAHNSYAANQGKLDGETVFQTGMTRAGNYDSQALSTSDQVYGLNEKLDKMSKDPNHLDPTEVEGIVSTANTIRSKNLAAADAWLARGSQQQEAADGTITYVGPSNAALIGDKTKIDQIRSQSTASIDRVIDRIQNKDYGSANWYAQGNKLVIDGAVSKELRDHAAAVHTAAINQIGGQAAVQEAASYFGPYADARKQWLGSYADTSAATGGAGGGPASATAAAAEINRAMPTMSSVDKADVIHTNIQNTLKVIAGSKDPKVINNEVSYLFGEKNKEFLTTVVPTGQRIAVYSELTSDATAKAIFEASKTNPELWNTYTHWAKVNFTNVFKEKADDIGRAIANVPGAKAVWDPEAHRIVYTNAQGAPGSEPQRPGGLFGYLGPAVDSAYQSVTSQTAQAGVDQLNLAIASIIRIADLNGKDPNQEVATAMQALNANFNAPKEGSLIDAIGSQVGAALGNTLQMINPAHVIGEYGSVLQGKNPTTGAPLSVKPGQADFSDVTGSVPGPQAFSLSRANGMSGAVQQASYRPEGTPPPKGGPVLANSYVQMSANVPQNANVATNYFVSQGWSPQVAAGIVGNLQAETGQKLNLKETGDGGTALGIAQWHADRRATFEKVMGKPFKDSDLHDQLSFVQWELTHTEKAAGNMLKSARTPEEAAYIINKYYERSADNSGNRQKYAAAIHQSITGNLDQPGSSGWVDPATARGTMVDPTGMLNGKPVGAKGDVISPTAMNLEGHRESTHIIDRRGKDEHIPEEQLRHNKLLNDPFKFDQNGNPLPGPAPNVEGTLA